MSSSPSRAPPSPEQKRRVVTPTNSLILLLPPNLFSPSLLPLFEAHFANYGPVAAWTPLERLGRVLVVYEDVESSAAARREMDGFVWEDDPADGLPPTSNPASSDAAENSSEPLPLRAFFGPSLSLPLASLHSTLLSVPALSRNFLISPPGSPPVGWEQTLEEAPNRATLPDQDSESGEDSWGDELARALRYLSVQSGGDDYETPEEDTDMDGKVLSTQTLIPAGASRERPSVTVSTPPSGASTSHLGTATPPPGAARITAVKATIESMLGRKKSFDDLVPPLRTIIPTARPPTDDERPFMME